MKSLLFSTVVITLLLTGCSGSSSELSSPTSGITPEQGRQATTRTVGPAAQKKVGQYVWVWQKFVIPPYIEVRVAADCPADYVVISGGYEVDSGALLVTATKPSSAFDRWVVSGPRDHSVDIKLTVYATCAAVK